MYVESLQTDWRSLYVKKKSPRDDEVWATSYARILHTSFSLFNEAGDCSQFTVAGNILSSTSADEVCLPIYKIPWLNWLKCIFDKNNISVRAAEESKKVNYLELADIYTYIQTDWRSLYVWRYSNR